MTHPSRHSNNQPGPPGDASGESQLLLHESQLAPLGELLEMALG